MQVSRKANQFLTDQNLSLIHCKWHILIMRDTFTHFVVNIQLLDYYNTVYIHVKDLNGKK